MPSVRRSGIASNWDALYEGFMSESDSPADDISPAIQVESRPSVIESLVEPVDDVPAEQDASATIQVRNRFIMAPSVSGMMVIDQHRAHVRVLLRTLPHHAFPTER